MKIEGYETPVGIDSPEKGRKEIPNEVAIKVQNRLFDLMIPDLIRPYLLNSEEDAEKDDPILMALNNLWASKYIVGFNGFTEYCNNKSADRKFIERAKLGQLTEEDYEDMIRFFETNEQGEPFFRDEVEVQEFIKQYVY